MTVIGPTMTHSLVTYYYQTEDILGNSTFQLGLIWCDLAPAVFLSASVVLLHSDNCRHELTKQSPVHAKMKQSAMYYDSWLV